MSSAELNPCREQGASSNQILVSPEYSCALGMELIRNVTNDEGLVRLAKARFELLDRFDEDEALDVLGRGFQLWRDQAEYMFVKGTHVKTGEVRKVAVKCSKRGNDVYTRRIDDAIGFLKRLDGITFFSPEDFMLNVLKGQKYHYFSDFDPKKTMPSNLLFVTFTTDPSSCSRSEAWNGIKKDKNGVEKVHKKGKNIGKTYRDHSHISGCHCIQCRWNRAITKLRKEYGRIQVFRDPEAFPNSEGSAYGYPHDHTVLLFEDASFNAFPMLDEKKDGSVGLSYRLKEMSEIKKIADWDAHVDIKAVSSGHGLGNYITKHMKNTQNGDSPAAVATQSIMWLCQKRTFSLSKGFQKSFTEFIAHLRNSNRTVQIDFDGKRISDWIWTFHGIVSAEKLGVSGKDWSLELDSETFNKFASKPSLDPDLKVVAEDWKLEIDRLFPNGGFSAGVKRKRIVRKKLEGGD